jgi:hypothetical protein
MNSEEWQKLAGKCALSSQPDRQLDGEIALGCGMPQAFFGEAFGARLVEGPELTGDGGTWTGAGKTFKAPAFTASIEAIIEVIRRDLPGWNLSIQTCPDFFEARLSNARLSSRTEKPVSRAQTPAQAACSVYCRAKAILQK